MAYDDSSNWKQSGRVDLPNWVLFQYHQGRGKRHDEASGRLTGPIIHADSWMLSARRTPPPQPPALPGPTAPARNARAPDPSRPAAPELTATHPRPRFLTARPHKRPSHNNLRGSSAARRPRHPAPDVRPLGTIAHSQVHQGDTPMPAPIASPNATSVERAHIVAVSTTIADIARFLQDNLGQRLTARIAGISDPKQVGRWATGAAAPAPPPKPDFATPSRSSTSSSSPKASTSHAPG